ncbi:MAG: fumarylacetoacetate hydrolase family protein [Chloroflexota bacterium]
MTVPIEPIAPPGALPHETLSKIADELAAAERDRMQIQPISSRHPAFDVAAAYIVQTTNIERRIAAGAALVGQKVGLTNRAMQAQLGVNEPDFGRLLDDMQVPAGAEVSLSDFIQPRIEPEIAFILRRDVVGPRAMRADVLSATEAVAPALEIIDSRIADWRITLVDTVADNASSARVVIGAPRSVRDLELIAMEGRLERDGEVVGAGRGADVLGDPAAAVAWLVNKLAEFGQSLKAGEVVISGALCASVPLGSGAAFKAELDGVGSVTVRVMP